MLVPITATDSLSDGLEISGFCSPYTLVAIVAESDLQHLKITPLERSLQIEALGYKPGVL